MSDETTHVYVQRELTRLVIMAEEHGLHDTVKRLLAAKDGIREDCHQEPHP